MCRLFEPYIVQLMGKLLERFGDVSASVRKATNNVARGIMGNLSSQGASHLMAGRPWAGICAQRLPDLL